MGKPETKKPITGRDIITDKLIQKTGSCKPVKSCFFFAYLKKRTEKIIPITKSKYTNSIPFSVNGFGI